MITEIEYISKTKAKVYLDEDFAFVLSKTEIDSMGLSKGHILTREEYTHIYDEILTRKAKIKVMNMLKAKDQTEYELRQKLKRDYFPEKVINRAIEYVKGYNYIDDRRYADSYIALRSSHKSRMAVRYELISKGIPEELIDDGMQAAGINDRESIMRLLKRKFCPEDLMDEKKKQKIFGYFMRKGFCVSDVRDSIRQFGINDDT